MKLSKLRLLPSLAALALFTVVTQWTMTTSLSAQTEDATIESVEPAEEAAAAGDQSLIDMYKNGGWAMYPLTLLSISAFGLIVYNFMAINPNQILQPSVLPEIDTALQALDIEKARSICDENPAPSTNIIHAGLVRVDTNRYNPEQVKEAVEEASAEELASPFILINYLSVIGSLAPMVGLLGTVSGMVKAFNVIGSEGAANAQALAGNISEALITTASGMIVGIPAMFFFFF
ncbi:MAG TPA: MotA/TolQ/ExbB proton channel family protein, partial [Opitutae bacterium]|nr:MotA/TolQ/ExbB proton channel family protein [Opitutae bacterium]